MGNSSSTPSTITHREKHDVFLSFRGQDTRQGFISHLHAGLRRKQMKTFIDYELVRGDEISPALLKAIEESKISVIIFSNDYASSKWCLDELVKILECKKMNGQIVIPVFYHVDPSDVRKQTKSFGDAFVKHEQDFGKDNDNKLKVQRWRTALTDASNLSGWDSSTARSEYELVEQIVKDILKKSNVRSVSIDFRHLVGIDSRVNCVKSLLCIGKSDFKIVGIWGMGGLGKTTIAKAVFDQISSEFEACHFFANVRQESEIPNGLVHLREKVLSKILDEEYVDLGTIYISEYIKNKLQCRKVLIVLDDVDNVDQIKILSEGIDQFGPGSRIIITTRDKQVLRNYSVNDIYDIKPFNDYESLQLFCIHAFKQDHPPNDYKVLAKRVVDYAKGNALALKVVGSSLFQKSQKYWESELQKLKRISNPEIDNMLRIGYNGLDNVQKNIFLDIAFFFKGNYVCSVKNILCGCYLSVEAGLSVLVDKSLVTISSGIIEMHDLVQEMGHGLVLEESVNKPWKRSRLHNHEEVCLVLQKNLGTEAIKGILLDMSKMKKDIYIEPQVFEKMWNLRILKFYNPTECISKVHGPTPNYLPDELRYLYWDGYPSKAMPSSFSFENLVELYFRGSNLEQLWEGEKDTPKLKQLVLSSSRYLTRIPEFSNAQCLEDIYLDGCKNLETLTNSIFNLRSLQILNVSGCLKLNKLPENLGNLKSLTVLELNSCNMEKIPEDIGCLSSLTKLELSNNNFKTLPQSIKQLSKLRNLYLSNCYMLEAIAELPLSLLLFEAVNCMRLHSLPDASYFAESVIGDKSLPVLLFYMFTNCMKLDKKVLSNIWEECLLKIQDEKGYRRTVDFQFCFPGSEIPKWFSYQSFGSSLNIKLPLHNWGNRKLLGFAFCAVLEFDEFCIYGRPAFIRYECGLSSYETKYDSIFTGYMMVAFSQPYLEKTVIDSDHVMLGYEDLSHSSKLFPDGCTSCSFEFSGLYSRFKMKCCGVYPIFQDLGETSESGSKRGCSYDHEEEVEPNHKRICTEEKFECCSQTSHLLSEGDGRVQTSRSLCHHNCTGRWRQRLRLHRIKRQKRWSILMRPFSRHTLFSDLRRRRLRHTPMLSGMRI